MLKPNLEFETECGFPLKNVIGVDEVGRGCLAGPVVAAACILPSDISEIALIHEITDSKLLSPAKREEIESELRLKLPKYAIGQASCEEVDELNIHHATHLAMKRAVQKLDLPKAFILVDGKFIPKDWTGLARPIIKGDQRSITIACASILAKVFRDRLMDELESEYPGYGLSKHKGYPTPFHKQALKKIGISAIHRKSFGPVKELLV